MIRDRIKPQPWHPEARTLFERGEATAVAIAAKFGVSSQYLRMIAEKYGWRRPDGFRRGKQTGVP